LGGSGAFFFICDENDMEVKYHLVQTSKAKHGESTEHRKKQNRFKIKNHAPVRAVGTYFLWFRRMIILEK
jgi:hypothetical protein